MRRGGAPSSIHTRRCDTNKPIPDLIEQSRKDEIPDRILTRPWVYRMTHIKDQDNEQRKNSVSSRSSSVH